jgi:regulator of protease activity HflC (stomatin/prohibitin superfamily)
MATVTVMEYERVVSFVDGRLAHVLEPGRHRYRRSRTQLSRVDVRPQLLTVPGQELLTADGLTVKVSALVRWRIVDAGTHVTAAASGYDVLYAAAQTAVRDSVAAVDLEAALADRPALSAGLTEAVGAAVQDLGVEVISAAVKDLMLGAELRRAYAETALARERGRAELERARAEAAALRSLANSARLIEEHPGLLHLRTLQAASEPGTTVVLTPPQPR